MVAVRANFQFKFLYQSNFCSLPGRVLQVQRNQSPATVATDGKHLFCVLNYFGYPVNRRMENFSLGVPHNVHVDFNQAVIPGLIPTVGSYKMDPWIMFWRTQRQRVVMQLFSAEFKPPRWELDQAQDL